MCYRCFCRSHLCLYKHELSVMSSVTVCPTHSSLASCPRSHFSSELTLGICSSVAPLFNSSMRVKWCLLFSGTPSWETALASTVRGLLAQSFICLQVQAMLAFKTCQGPHSPDFSGVILHISNTVLLACHARHSNLGFSVTLRDYIFGQLLGLLVWNIGSNICLLSCVHCFGNVKVASHFPALQRARPPRCCRALETTGFFPMSVVLTFQTVSHITGSG